MQKVPSNSAKLLKEKAAKFNRDMVSGSAEVLLNDFKEILPYKDNKVYGLVCRQIMWRLVCSMKKVCAYLLSLSLILSLASCGGDSESSTSLSDRTSAGSSAVSSAAGEFDQEVEINIALHTADGIHDEAIKLFKEKIEEASGDAPRYFGRMDP